jgi:hypothetical protein
LRSGAPIEARLIALQTVSDVARNSICKCLAGLAIFLAEFGACAIVGTLSAPPLNLNPDFGFAALPALHWRPVA